MQDDLLVLGSGEAKETRGAAKRQKVEKPIGNAEGRLIIDARTMIGSQHRFLVRADTKISELVKACAECINMLPIDLRLIAGDGRLNPGDTIQDYFDTGSHTVRVDVMISQQGC